MSDDAHDIASEMQTMLGDWLQTRHLTQPLQSIPVEQDQPFVPSSLSVLGVSQGGRLIGSVDVAALSGDDWQRQMRPLSDDQVIDGAASLFA